MTSYNRGAVVLVQFIFADESGTKQRPALVISTEAYHRSRQEVIIAAITSQIDRLLLGDYLIKNWQAAGLLYPSVITGIIRTIKQSMITKKLGVMPTKEMEAYGTSLSKVLGF
ncbi:MAG: type II toxin-antitoxin system PemK/MazF family toxin [Acidobacteria bacterium]|nr:type II toxin-antitoxin system PemK/MazF family toxin [Acidobacteriota bacterium]MBI3656756.1 type II toxin-antitoxin system PemK/MazF family toxin [Acidobacteriota bacterium]